MGPFSPSGAVYRSKQASRAVLAWYTFVAPPPAKGKGDHSLQQPSCVSHPEQNGVQDGAQDGVAPVLLAENVGWVDVTR